MATQITNYQCPACTGPLKFSENSGKLECEYCGMSYDVAYIEELYAKKEESAASAGTENDWDLAMAGGVWSEEEAANMRAYSCPSCGAQVICDVTTAATSCPYCGNPTTVPGNFAGTLKPDFVIPFTLDKEFAKNALKQHYKGKKFLPGSYLSGNRIEEMKGLYVPFWLFNCRTDGKITYNATRVHTHRTSREEITVTEHYKVSRSGNVRFEKVPVDGSVKMPDEYTEAIEPYDYSGLKPFSSAYLPGFLADRYDMSSEECNKRANERIVVSTEDAFLSTVHGYNSVTTASSNIRIEKGEVKYAMFPVWMLNTKWKDKDFMFAMNAQTGKLVGDLPVDKGKFWLWFVCIAAPIFAVLNILFFWI